MRLVYAFITTLVLAAPATVLASVPRDDHDAAQTKRTVAAAPDVVVELTHQSGDVVVRGWDRKEVQASSDEAPRIELRQYESAAGAAEAGAGAPPPPGGGVFFNSPEEGGGAGG